MQVKRLDLLLQSALRARPGAVQILYFENLGFLNLEFLKFDSNNVNIAVRCMWFGALGGLVISLKGVYDHHCNRGDWDDGFLLWHLGRPISGALTGLITLVLLLAINPNEPNEPVAYAIAFIFGTQERRFFNFLSSGCAGRSRTWRRAGQYAQGDEHHAAGRQGGHIRLHRRPGFPGRRNGHVRRQRNERSGRVEGRADHRRQGSRRHARQCVDVTVVNPDKKRALLVDKFTYTT